MGFFRVAPQRELVTLENLDQDFKGTAPMHFPIFYGLIAPDIASAKPLSAVNVAIDLATKLDAQLSIVIGALQISVPNILHSGVVDGLIS